MEIEMERPVTYTTSINELFVDKIFRVPDYQRAYAWDKKNLEDFWNDIKEGLITQTPHYWGTITLRDTGEHRYDKNSASTFNIYEVVDGQQRVTTIYLFLLALSKPERKPAIRNKFIKCGNIYRVELGSLNSQFLRGVVDKKNPPVKLTTNKLLKEALEYFDDQIRSYENIDDLTEYIQRCTFSLEFQIKDKNLAIKAFESLNDRGKALTLLDKIKSFSMFYSSRYLESKLGSTINGSFGSIFELYDTIKEIGEREGIEYIRNPRYRFSEDELLRFFYHYFAQYSINKHPALGNIGYDYTITTENVFEEFLKNSLNTLKDKKEELYTFLDDFLNTFKNFVETFCNLIRNAEKRSLYRKMFCFSSLNVAVYPLIISAKTENILNDRLLRKIESLDLRVYKVRGTDPRADLYKNTISRIKISPDFEEIYDGIENFVDEFMWNAEFQSYLSRDMYGKPAVKFILWEFEKHQDSSFDEWSFDLYKDVQIEHIFPEEPTFSFPAFAFQDEADYRDNLNRLGNLTLLEESINKRVRNKSPQNKASEYQKSNVLGTKKLGFDITNHGFTKDGVEKRNIQIVKFCLQRWKS